MDDSFDEKQWPNDLGPETRIKLTELGEEVKDDLVRWMRSKSPSGDVQEECDELCQIVSNNFKKYEWN